MNNSKIFAYGRVSSVSQNEARQIEAFKEFGVNERDIFLDKGKTGANFEREQYKLLKSMLREKDLLIISSIDRLGRSYDLIVEEWKDITKNIKADIVVLDMPLLDTRQNKDLLGTFINDLILQILSYVAQTEKEKINTRTKEGRELALKNGTKSGRPFGRPKIEKPSNFEEVIASWKRKEIKSKDAISILGLKPNTFYNMVNGL